MADIVVTDEWQALSVLSGFAIGTQVKLQNKGTVNGLMIESTLQPVATSTDGELITSIVGSEPSKIIPVGSGEIWLKTNGKGYSIAIHAQEY